jgi:hypothetical protein
MDSAFPSGEEFSAQSSLVQFHLTEKMGLFFRAEFFNIFNYPNFGNPTNNLSSPLFGYSTQMLASSLAGADNAGFNPLYQIGGPRSIQLALKLRQSFAATWMVGYSPK